MIDSEYARGRVWGSPYYGGYMNLVLPFVVYTLSLAAVVLIVHRGYRMFRKCWCPRCKRFSAQPQYVREVPAGETGSACSHRRLCYTRKICACGLDEVLTHCYIKIFTAAELEKGYHRSDVVNL